MAMCAHNSVHFFASELLISNYFASEHFLRERLLLGLVSTLLFLFITQLSASIVNKFHNILLYL